MNDKTLSAAICLKQLTGKVKKLLKAYSEAFFSTVAHTHQIVTQVFTSVYVYTVYFFYVHYSFDQRFFFLICDFFSNYFKLYKSISGVYRSRIQTPSAGQRTNNVPDMKLNLRPKLVNIVLLF